MNVAIVAAYTSAVAAGLSLAWAIWKGRTNTREAKMGAYILVGLWTLLPPVWFLIESHTFPWPDDPDHKGMQYAHELARNIWIALVIVLAALTGIKWPPRN